MEVFSEQYFSNRHSGSDLYFKDFLTFCSRHTNYELYKYIKQVIADKFNQTLSEEQIVRIFFSIIEHPDILKKYIYLNNPKAFTNKRPEKTEQDYGNLRKSFLSYFDFFENPTRKNNLTEDGNIFYYDYLEYKSLDAVTNRFPLDNNIVLVEFRAFAMQMRLLFNKFNLKLDENIESGFTVRQFKEFVKLVDSSRTVKEIFEKEYNPFTKRFVNKCKPGYTRNDRFQCRKTLKRKPLPDE